MSQAGDTTRDQMTGDDFDVTFVVNEIPPQTNRTRYQHGQALVCSFDTTIVSKGPVPSELREEAVAHVCFDDHWLCRFPVFYPVWLLHVVFWVNCSAVVTGPNSLFLVAGRLASFWPRRTWVADVWDDPALVLDSFRTSGDTNHRLRYFYHLLLFRAACVAIADVDVAITSIHPGVLQRYSVDEERIVELTNGVQGQFLADTVSVDTDAEVRIVYVGQVNTKRNVETYVDTLGSIDVEWPVIVDLVGPVDDEVRRRIETRDSPVTFNVHGVVPHKTAIRIINEAHICLPTVQVERTNDAVKDCGLGTLRARDRVHARVQVFLALCLRLVVAITNYERGDNPGSTIITV